MDLGPLAYVALIPLLLIAGEERRWVGIGAAFTATVLYHLVGLSWIAMVTPEGWLLTSFLEGFYGVALICLPLWIRRRTGLPLVLTLPALGVALECIRGNYFPFIAFPWLLWGQTQHARSFLIQVADLGGVYALSFLVLSVNAAGADLGLLLRARTREERDLSPADTARLRWVLMIPAGLLLLSFGYGALRLRQVRAALEPGPRLLVVQVDVPQSLKDGVGVTALELARKNLSLARAGLNANRGGEPIDAILLSETMWPWPLPDERSAAGRNGYKTFLERMTTRYGAGHVRELRTKTQQLFNLATQAHAPVLVGARDYGLGGGREHNSYYCIAPDPPRRARIIDRYDKINLVPVSEYIPFQGSSVMGWFYRLLKSFVPPGFTVFEPGPGPVLMPAGEHRLAPNICFEISFPELLRRSTAAGATVHVCPANDAWFVRGGARDVAKATAEIPLARAHTVLRAVENRRAVVRCVNRGVSLIADPTGEVVAQVEQNQEGRLRRVGVAGFLLERAPTSALRSFYVRFGNVFAFVCALAALVTLGCAWAGRRLLPATEGLPGGHPSA